MSKTYILNEFFEGEFSNTQRPEQKDALSKASSDSRLVIFFISDIVLGVKDSSEDDLKDSIQKARISEGLKIEEDGNFIDKSEKEQILLIFNQDSGKDALNNLKVGP